MKKSIQCVLVGAILLNQFSFGVMANVIKEEESFFYASSGDEVETFQLHDEQT